MNNIDWDLIRSFLVVSKQGSISAAARELSVSQPTISRDIQALEAQTGLNLFKRTTQGLALTEAGLGLVDAARQMDAAADKFARQVFGFSEDLTGDVRLSVNEIVGIYLLPPAITAFRKKHPGVQIEIVISNLTSSLSKREADIALRMYRPSQADLIAKRLPDMELGFYAHQDYLEQFGEPKDFDEFLKHTIIGFDQNMEFIEGAAQFGYTFVRDNFAIRSDHLLAHIGLARSGAGIIGTHVELAKQWPELKRIMHWAPYPALEFWIVCHRDVQFNSRIRALMDFLSAWFADPYRHVLI